MKRSWSVLCFVSRMQGSRAIQQGKRKSGRVSPYSARICCRLISIPLRSESTDLQQIFLLSFRRALLLSRPFPSLKEKKSGPRRNSSSKGPRDHQSRKTIHTIPPKEEVWIPGGGPKPTRRTILLGEASLKSLAVYPSYGSPSSSSR